MLTSRLLIFFSDFDDEDDESLVSDVFLLLHAARMLLMSRQNWKIFFIAGDIAKAVPMILLILIMIVHLV